MKKLKKIVPLLAIIGIAIYFFMTNDPDAIGGGEKSASVSSALVDKQAMEPVAHDESAQLPAPAKSTVVTENGELWINGKKFTDLPRSLRGTEIGGNLRVDDQGNLIIEAEVKELFDYFLNTIGELPMEDVIARLTQGIMEFLPPLAADQAIEILNNYLAYKTATGKIPYEDYSLSNEKLDLNHYAHVMSERSLLRRQYMGETVADAFWKDSESYDQFTLERTRIEGDTTLSAQEKSELISSFEADLPEQYREAREKFTKLESINKTVQALEQRHASQQEIAEAWREQYGEDAAVRYQELQQQREVWNQRYNDYTLKRQAIIQSPLDNNDQNVAIQDLQQKLFDETEQKRVQSLDKIAGEQPKTH